MTLPRAHVDAREANEAVYCDRAKLRVVDLQPPNLRLCRIGAPCVECRLQVDVRALRSSRPHLEVDFPTQA